MKYLLIFLFFGSVASAQISAGSSLLKRNDFKLTDGRMVASAVGCIIPGEEKLNPIQVSIVCLQAVFHHTGIGKINDMILFADGKVRNAVSGRYKPSEFKMAYNPSTKSWSLTSLFSTEDQGVVTQSLMALDFDASGNFLEMKRVF